MAKHVPIDTPKDLIILRISKTKTPESFDFFWDACRLWMFQRIVDFEIDELKSILYAFHASPHRHFAKKGADLESLIETIYEDLPGMK